MSISSSLAAVAILASPVLADATGVTFEAPKYHEGTINGQNGWSSTNPAYDEAVVKNGSSAPRDFGAQSFRMSNAVVTGSFGDWMFAPPLLNPAGDSAATAGAFPSGVRQTQFNV